MQIPRDQREIYTAKAGPLTAQEVAFEKEFKVQEEAYRNLDSETAKLGVTFLVAGIIAALLWWGVN